MDLRCPLQCNALLDLIHRCTQAQGSDADMHAILHELGQIIPFDAAVVAFGHASATEAPQATKLYAHRCDDWLADYQRANLGAVDPIVAHAVRTERPFRWRDAFGLHGPLHRRYREIKSDINRRDGIALAYSSRYGAGTALISLAMQPHEIAEAHTKAIEYLLPHLHAVMLRATDGHAIEHDRAAIGLTPREVEVLKWIREGKCSWDIGMLLRVSERTVKFHLANIFSKLQVSTRAQAIARAMQLGLL